MKLYMVIYDSWTAGYGIEPRILGVYTWKCVAEKAINEHIRYVKSEVNKLDPKDRFDFLTEEGDLLEYLKPEIIEIEQNKTYSTMMNVGYDHHFSNGSDSICLGSYAE